MADQFGDVGILDDFLDKHLRVGGVVLPRRRRGVPMARQESAVDPEVVIDDTGVDHFQGRRDQVAEVSILDRVDRR